jgi:hypothetical protein
MYRKSPSDGFDWNFAEVCILRWWTMFKWHSKG